MTEADPKELLRRARVIAVVGCSASPSKAAHTVPAEMLDAGFDIRPVNPHHAGGSILGRRVHATLAEVEGPIDIVDVFRPSDEAADVARAAIAAGARAVWLQLGITSEDAERACAAAGVAFVQDRCLSIELRKLQRAGWTGPS